LNERDEQNLRFLMSLKKEDIKEWLASVPPDDVDYAFALLTTAALDEFDKENENLDCSDAKLVLSKYMLAGKH